MWPFKKACKHPRRDIIGAKEATHSFLVDGEWVNQDPVYIVVSFCNDCGEELRSEEFLTVDAAFKHERFLREEYESL